MDGRAAPRIAVRTRTPLGKLFDESGGSGHVQGNGLRLGTASQEDLSSSSAQIRQHSRPAHARTPAEGVRLIFEQPAGLDPQADRDSICAASLRSLDASWWTYQEDGNPTLESSATVDVAGKCIIIRRLPEAAQGHRRAAGRSHVRRSVDTEQPVLSEILQSSRVALRALDRRMRVENARQFVGSRKSRTWSRCRENPSFEINPPFEVRATSVCGWVAHWGSSRSTWQTSWLARMDDQCDRRSQADCRLPTGRRWLDRDRSLPARIGAMGNFFSIKLYYIRISKRIYTIVVFYPGTC